jgi:hypothetical protein
VGKNVAYFSWAFKLTNDHAESSNQLAIVPGRVSNAASAGRLKFKEQFTTIGHYLKPIFTSAPEIKPASIAFINAKLDLRRLMVAGIFRSGS